MWVANTNVLVQGGRIRELSHNLQKTSFASLLHDTELRTKMRRGYKRAEGREERRAEGARRDGGGDRFIHLL